MANCSSSSSTAPGCKPAGAVASLTPDAAARAIDAPLVVGSGAEALVAARGIGEALDLLPSAANALALPQRCARSPPRPVYARAPDAKPAAAADEQRPRPARSRSRSSPAIRRDLDEVMQVMDRRLRSRVRRGLDALAMRRDPAAGRGPADASPATTKAHAAGFALERTVADEAELLLLAVDRAAQRGGIGDAVARPFHRCAVARAARSRLHLEVRDGNPRDRDVPSLSAFTPRAGGRKYYRGQDGR